MSKAEGDARIAELLDELKREHEDHSLLVQDAATVARQLTAAERRLAAADRVAAALSLSLDWLASHPGDGALGAYTKVRLALAEWEASK